MPAMTMISMMKLFTTLQEHSRDQDTSWDPGREGEHLQQHAGNRSKLCQCLQNKMFHKVNRLRSFPSRSHSVTWSLGHLVTRSLGHLVTCSLGHSVTRSLYHSVILFQHYYWLTNWLTDKQYKNLQVCFADNNIYCQRLSLKYHRSIPQCPFNQ